MISFRFHIVSLTAVFLALAIGIGVGAAVVDRATVDAIQDQLDNVRERADSTNAANDELREELALWNRFADEGASELVQGHLDVPVVLIGFEGVDRELLERQRELVVAAGARYQGTLWFTSRFQLDNPEHVRSLQAILGTEVARPDALQRAAATGIAESWAGLVPPGLLPALRDAAFVDYRPPSAEGFDLAAVATPETYVVVVSGPGAVVPNQRLALPFTTTLAGLLPIHVVAAEAASGEGDSAERAVFLGPLRESAEVSGRLSTVDNLEDVRGRVAVVLALDALTDEKTGHFGVGPGARRLVPEPSP